MTRNRVGGDRIRALEQLYTLAQEDEVEEENSEQKKSFERNVLHQRPQQHQEKQQLHQQQQQEFSLYQDRFTGQRAQAPPSYSQIHRPSVQSPVSSSSTFPRESWTNEAPRESSNTERPQQTSKHADPNVPLSDNEAREEYLTLLKRHRQIGTTGPTDDSQDSLSSDVPKSPTQMPVPEATWTEERHEEDEVSNSIADELSFPSHQENVGEPQVVSTSSDIYLPGELAP